MKNLTLLFALYSVATLISFLTTLNSWRKIEKCMNDFPIGDLELFHNEYDLSIMNILFPISILMLKTWKIFCSKINVYI